MLKKVGHLSVPAIFLRLYLSGPLLFILLFCSAPTPKYGLSCNV